MIGTRQLARAFCYPQSDWFSISLGGAKDETHITWDEWEAIVLKLKELRAISEKAVILEPTKTKGKEV
jgi:hypothetical protein